MRPCHDQSQISARFDGNLTVRPSIRHHWLRDFPKTLDRCSIRSTLGKLENFQLNHLVFAFLVAARFADPILSLPPYQFARDNPHGLVVLSGTLHSIRVAVRRAFAEAFLQTVPELGDGSGAFFLFMGEGAFEKLLPSRRRVG
jgi:hypothetical protein